MEQEAVMSSKYVRADDVMELINTSNRGTCDYFIVDQIEELCRSEKIYDLDKVVEQLEKASQTSASAKSEAIIGMCGASANHYGGEECAYERAIEIVKGGGVDAF